MGRVAVEAADAQLDIKHPILDKGFVVLVDYLGGDRRVAEAAWVSTYNEVEVAERTAFLKKLDLTT